MSKPEEKVEDLAPDEDAAASLRGGPAGGTITGSDGPRSGGAGGGSLGGGGDQTAGKSDGRFGGGAHAQ